MKSFPRGLRYRLGLAGTALTAFFLWSSAAPALAAGCPTDGNHWYAQATSGCCDAGTMQNTYLPSHWSVDHPSDSTTDEGTWVMDKNDNTQAVEVGYFSGWWPYPTKYWTNGLVGYTTRGETGVTNGAYGAHASGYFSAGAGISIEALANGQAYVGPDGWTWPGYSVPHAENFAQGEVTSSTNTWMGGGSGEQFTAWWSPDGSAWYLWGYNNDCSNSPYWISQSNGYTWSNGGY